MLLVHTESAIFTTILVVLIKTAQRKIQGKKFNYNVVVK